MIKLSHNGNVYPELILFRKDYCAAIDRHHQAVNFRVQSAPGSEHSGDYLAVYPIACIRECSRVKGVS